MIHTLPTVLRTINDKKGTALSPVDVSLHLLSVSNYLNVLHSLVCGPDDSPERLKIEQALKALK